MNCYNLNCKEECNKYKKMYCIFKITRKQQQLIAKIKENKYCNICGEVTVKAKYQGEYINLCTECGVNGRKVA